MLTLIAISLIVISSLSLIGTGMALNKGKTGGEILGGLLVSGWTLFTGIYLLLHTCGGSG